MSDVEALNLLCGADRLQAMLHAGDADTGVLIVVGGPQYRVGSHRQFVLLARALAASGTPVMRFDYRGLGDSEGEARSFEDIDADIREAIDEFFRRNAQLRRVVIWGLCDAASAALFYGATDARVAGLVLLNPWVRSQQSVAQAYLRSYYVRRLFDWRAWRDLLLGGRLTAAVRSFLGTARQAIGGEPASTQSAARPAEAQPLGLPTQTAGSNAANESPLSARMRRGFAAFKGPVLLVLSGDDITAAEFRAVADQPRWRRLLSEPRVTMRQLEAADHTFSCRAWRDQVAAWTGEWLHRQWPAQNVAGRQ